MADNGLTVPMTMSERAAAMQPCPIGTHGFCCKNCMMGPCRVMTEAKRSVCGASQALVAARNVLRFAVGGAAAHCGHAQHLLDFLGMPSPRDYVRERAPRYLYELWDRVGLLPSEDGAGHFFDLSEAMHLTTFGVSGDFRDVLRWCLRIGVIDGYYGLYLSSELERRMWGAPIPTRGPVDLGCIDPSRTNVALHGHEPMLADAMVAEARKHDDVNLVGVCCTGASLLARHGVPLAGHMTLQEEVVRTGLVDAMVVDVQCVMPSLSEMCECFHTLLVTTSEIARMPRALHLPITDRASSAEVARKVIAAARGRRLERRPGVEEEFRRTVRPPAEALVGFSETNVDARALYEQYRRGETKGFLGVVGCVHPRLDADAWVDLYRELGEDHVIFTTGCMGFEFARRGLLDGERFFHLGSCVNNAHMAEVFGAIAAEAGRRIDEMPFLVSAPMPVSEKAVAIGLFFAALGCTVHLGYPHLFGANASVASHLNETLESLFHSRLLLCDHPRTLRDTIREGLLDSVSAGDV